MKKERREQGACEDLKDPRDQWEEREVVEIKAHRECQEHLDQGAIQDPTAIKEIEETRVRQVEKAPGELQGRTEEWVRVVHKETLETRERPDRQGDRDLEEKVDPWGPGVNLVWKDDQAPRGLRDTEEPLGPKDSGELRATGVITVNREVKEMLEKRENREIKAPPDSLANKEGRDQRV